jgi:hypothetical protein
LEPPFTDSGASSDGEVSQDLVDVRKGGARELTRGLLGVEVGLHGRQIGNGVAVDGVGRLVALLHGGLPQPTLHNAGRVVEEGAGFGEGRHRRNHARFQLLEGGPDFRPALFTKVQHHWNSLRYGTWQNNTSVRPGAHGWNGTNADRSHRDRYRGTGKGEQMTS